MTVAPRSDQDDLRIEKLKSYLVLDTDAEKLFDKLTALEATKPTGPNMFKGQISENLTNINT